MWSGLSCRGGGTGAEGALLGKFRHLHADIFGNREFVEHLRNRGKFFDGEENRERDLIPLSSSFAKPLKTVSGLLPASLPRVETRGYRKPSRGSGGSPHWQGESEPMSHVYQPAFRLRSHFV